MIFLKLHRNAKSVLFIRHQTLKHIIQYISQYSEMSHPITLLLSPRHCWTHLWRCVDDTSPHTFIDTLLSPSLLFCSFHNWHVPGSHNSTCMLHLWTRHTLTPPRPHLPLSYFVYLFISDHHKTVSITHTEQTTNWEIHELYNVCVMDAGWSFKSQSSENSTKFKWVKNKYELWIHCYAVSLVVILWFCLIVTFNLPLMLTKYA